MIRKRLGLCLILLAIPLALCCGTARAAEVWDGTVANVFAGGSGTVEDPYQIANGAQLALVKDYANKSVHFRLTDDIVLNDTASWESWTADKARPTNGRRSRAWPGAWTATVIRSPACMSAGRNSRGFSPARWPAAGWRTLPSRSPRSSGHVMSARWQAGAAEPFPDVPTAAASRVPTLWAGSAVW